MLDELREENRQLRDKLKLLRLETAASFQKIPISNTVFPTTDKLELYANVGSGQYSATMLSDKAKVIRGETSKRINLLLQDWRDYREKTEAELRRRARSEQTLKEVLARKDLEIEGLSHEVQSYRTLSMEQKNTLAVLSEEKKSAEKYKVQCSELERQLNKERRNVSELSCELRTKEDFIRQGLAEKEALLALNSELRSSNVNQKKRLEMCERDVTETSHELEMLEDMVKALQDRKSLLETTKNLHTLVSRPGKVQEGPLMLPTKPLSPVSFEASNSTPRTFRPQFNSTAFEEPTPMKSRIAPRSLGVDINPATVEKTSSSSTNSDQAETKGNDNSFTPKKSALSALESLQRDHDKKCNHLADHIKKLKEENKEKEERLRILGSPPTT